jgi:antitoxin ParD1/3/4
MTIESIPEDLRAFVSSELGSGRYCSLEELLAEGLRLLHEHETFLAAHLGDLRAQIAEGVAQAERGELGDGEEALERLGRELRERQREG